MRILLCKLCKPVLALLLCFVSLGATNAFAYIEESNETSCPPTLEFAASEGDFEVVELLLEYSVVDDVVVREDCLFLLKNLMSSSSIHTAAYRGDRFVLFRWLLTEEGRKYENIWRVYRELFINIEQGSR